jgi:hypothetical protein
VAQDDDRPVLELKTPFASRPSLGRLVIDRNVKLNWRCRVSLPWTSMPEVTATEPLLPQRQRLVFRCRPVAEGLAADYGLSSSN